MSHRCILLALAIVILSQARTLATEECQLELADGPPMQLAPAVSKELNTSHIKLRLDSEDFCEVWIAKAWMRRAEDQGASNTASILYPIEPGSLVGAIRLAHTCFDLRDQEIPAGVYTLRYAVQPDIETHTDSHDSRDFLLLVASSADKTPQVIMEPDKLIDMSAESIASMHPAFLPLLKVDKPAGAPAVRRDARDPEGWVLQVHGKDKQGKGLPMEVILLHAKIGG